MLIKINSKKQIEGEKPVIDFQGPDEITFKFDTELPSNVNFYIAGSRIYKSPNEKILFWSSQYSIDGNEITFTVDTYTEPYLNYVNEYKTAINLEIGDLNDSKHIFMLDKVFANPRVYLPGIPPSGNLDEYYTIDETDSLFTTKVDFSELSGIVSGDVANLANNYWTKQEVAQAIAQIQTMKIVVVQELPPIEDAEEYTIYLVPSSDQSIGNVYDEYLVINHQFEKIGSTAIDMTQYVQKSLSGIGGGYINWRTSDGNYNRLRIGDGGFQWGDATAASDSNFAAYGAETNIRGIGVRLGWNESSHIYHGNTIENTPGGFVIQNSNGKISAPYIEATSGLTALSATLAGSTFTTSASGAKNFILQAESSPLDEYGLFSNTISMAKSGNRYNINIGKTGSGSGPGNVNIYGIGINLNPYTLSQLTLKGKAPNTPNGFVLQNSNGVISGANDVIVDNVSLSGIPNTYLPISGTVSDKILLKFKSSTDAVNTVLNVDENTSNRDYYNLSIGDGATEASYKGYIINIGPGNVQCRIYGTSIFYGTPSIYSNSSVNNPNTPGGFVIQNSNGFISGQKAISNTLTTIPPSSATYTLNLGEYTHIPDDDVTYTLPSASSGKVNEITLEVSFENTTSITFSGTYEYDDTITPALNDVILYLIRYSDIKQKWIIYPLI